MLDGLLAGLISSNTLGGWQDVFLGSTLVVSWIALALVLRMLWVTKAQVTGIDHRCRELSHDLQIAGNAAIGMGQRIIHLEKRLQQSNHISTQLAQPMPTQTVTSPSQGLKAEDDRAALVRSQTKAPQHSVAPQQVHTQPQSKPIAQTKPAVGQLSPEAIADQVSLKQRIAAAAELKAIQDGVAKSTDAFYQSNATQKVKPHAQQKPKVQSKPLDVPSSVQTNQVASAPAAAIGTTGSSTVGQVDSIVSPFDQAKKLLSKGMSELDVAKRCGLSKAEAALLAMVQRQSQASHSAAVS